MLDRYEKMVRDEMLSNVQEGQVSEDENDLQEQMQKAAEEETDDQQVIFDDE